MAKVALITFGLVVVFLGMALGAKKKCYSCPGTPKQDEQKPNCETFNDDQLEDCNNDCYKSVNELHDGTTQYTRGCLTDELKSCDKMIEKLPTSVDCYQCSEDKCNSSTTFMASLSLVAILSIIVRQFV